MKCMLVKTPNGWCGATADDDAEYRKFQRRMKSSKAGRWLRMQATSPREGWMHRKFFALLNLIVENSEVYTTVEKALIAVKLVVGHFDLIADPTTGEIIKTTRSINYDTMSQEEFETFYTQAIDGILQHVLTQMDRATADHLLEMIVDGWVNVPR